MDPAASEMDLGIVQVITREPIIRSAPDGARNSPQPSAEPDLQPARETETSSTTTELTGAETAPASPQASLAHPPTVTGAVAVSAPPAEAASSTTTEPTAATAHQPKTPDTATHDPDCALSLENPNPLNEPTSPNPEPAQPTTDTDTPPRHQKCNCTLSKLLGVTFGVYQAESGLYVNPDQPHIRLLAYFALASESDPDGMIFQNRSLGADVPRENIFPETPFMTRLQESRDMALMYGRNSSQPHLRHTVVRNSRLRKVWNVDDEE